MELLELTLLAIASAFWPALVVVDLIALRTPQPVPLLAWFLAWGLLTTISEGLVIVFALEGTTLGSSRSSAGGWANIIGGCAALLAAYVLRARAARSRNERPAAQAPVKKPGVGPHTVAQLVLSWSHPGRITSEAAFARLAGAAPIPASSGKTIRYRLDRSGDRKLNRALHMILVTRKRAHPATIAYGG